MISYWSRITLLLCSPALAHEFKKMGERVVVGAPFGLGELFRPFVELGRHLGGFSRRTTQRCEECSQLVEIHCLPLNPPCRPYSALPTGRLPLLDGISRDDLDALDAHSLVRAVGRMRWSRGDFFEHVIAFNQLAECCVLAVQRAGIAMADKKLAAG